MNKTAFILYVGKNDEEKVGSIKITVSLFDMLNTGEDGGVFDNTIKLHIIYY